MVYHGGKARIAKPIAKLIVDSTPDGLVYAEPFCGACSVAVEYAKLRPGQPMVLSDCHPDLILMWKALQEGWVPPSDVSPELYNELRHAEPSALRGFVGFGCSFGGKWFGGYARNIRPGADGKYRRTKPEEAVRGLMGKIKHIRHAKFVERGYQDISLSRVEDEPLILYLDPPYLGTTGYGGFNHEHFWRWAQFLACRRTPYVFVSERTAPQGWVPVWEKPYSQGLRHADRDLSIVERVYRLRDTF